MEDFLGEVSLEERLSRFIFSSKLLSSNRVHYSNFMPSEKYPEISVYRTQSLSEDEIWEIDEIYVSGLRGKKSYARADLKAETIIKEEGLRIEPNGIPHNRHANICFSDRLVDGHKRLIAMKLSEASILIKKDQVK